MKPKGKIILVDDDADEWDFFSRTLKKVCDNEILCAQNGEDGLKLIQEHKDNIFMIVSDINMPKMNGFEMKRVIEGTPELKMKSIPFIFQTTHNNVVVIKEAYSLNIQGLLFKTSNLNELQKRVELILTYWTTVVHPNTLD
jgi:response regulator RpfG family c-di-GMP phosphodiesterase